jgi:dTDP-4-amino-4,6-dideoxygalactose transaminase
MWDVPLFELNFDGQEAQAVQTVIDSRWLTMGEQTQSFETDFSEMLGQGAQCLAVSSATAALHMSLLAMGVGPGDEVIIPALTFVADANVVRMVGARPVLADSVSMDNWNVSADTVRQKITKKTRGVIVVHFAGYPCDMHELVRLCKDQGIALIEDVAHAPNATIDGQQCGTFGDVGCFSFFSNKNLSIGEGGMVCSTDNQIVKKLSALRSHGMTTLTLDRHKGRAISYDVEQIGLNYRMDEMRASLGKVQLSKLAAGNSERGRHVRAYSEQFAATSIEVPFQQVPDSVEPAYHIMPVLLPKGVDRPNVIQSLRDKKIQSSIHYPPFWEFTAYASDTSNADAPKVSEIAARELTLPLYPTMTDRQRDSVVSALLSAVNDK